MSIERQMRIRDYRLRQPRGELIRKERKANKRGNEPSQEMLDLFASRTRQITAAIWPSSQTVETGQ